MANLERRNELCIGVDSAECPYAANLHRIAHFYVAVLLSDEAPNLIHLQPLAGKVLHLCIHHGGATLTNFDAEAHDRITVDTGNPLYGTNTRTLCQCSDCRDFLVVIEYVRHISLDVITVPQ